jgi:hypothetical protein
MQNGKLAASPTEESFRRVIRGRLGAIPACMGSTVAEATPPRATLNLYGPFTIVKVAFARFGTR